MLWKIVQAFAGPMFPGQSRDSLEPLNQGVFPGVRVELGPIDGCRMKIHYTADGMINVAKGARGGLPGGPVRSFRREADGRLEPQPACAGVELAPGQSIVSVSSGGGGYGAPWNRDPERVAHDVREGWVSRERARDVYGVELDAAGAVLADATRQRRAGMAEAGNTGQASA